MPVIKVLKFVESFGWGGTERQFVNLGLGLDPARFAIHFGCLRRFGVLLEKIESFGLPILHYDISSVRSLQALRSEFVLARDIRRFGIGIVHTYGFYSNVFAIPAAKLAGAKVVASIRDLGIYLTPRQKTAQRWVCKLADHVLVNASAIKEWLVSDGYDERNITVIPNGIDLARFPEPAIRGTLHRELGLSVDTPLVAVVGRLNRLKGVEDFLAAAAIVAPDFPKARFLIMGESSFTTRGRAIVIDTSYQDELMRLTVRLRLQDRVIFSGYRADVERVLPDLAISVLPSLSEGLSNTLLESMAAAVPVIATRVGGAPEVIADGQNGLLVPAGDPGSLAGAIRRLLAAPSLAREIGLAGRRRIAERYSTERLVESMSEFYESLLQHRRPASTQESLNPI